MTYPGLPARSKDKSKQPIKYGLRYEAWCCKWPIISAVATSITTTLTGAEFWYLTATDSWWKAGGEPGSGVHPVLVGLGITSSLAMCLANQAVQILHYRGKEHLIETSPDTPSTWTSTHQYRYWLNFRKR